jgi:hypothetical protein
MKINNFLNIPIVKIIVTLLFFYYIYEQTKDDPRSASYQIKNANFDESVGAVKTALKLTAQSASNDDKGAKLPIDNSTAEIKSKPLVFVDEIVGQSGSLIACGNEVFIQYSISDKESKAVLSQSSYSLKIGTKTNLLVEKSLIGMKVGGVRVVDIPSDYITGEGSVDELLKTKKLIYKIVAINVINPQTSENCEL